MKLPKLTERDWLAFVLEVWTIPISKQFAIATQLNPKLRGYAACYGNFTPKQRYLLANNSTSKYAGWVAINFPVLPLKYRIALIKQAKKTNKTRICESY